eukprot:234517-Chlamydomonas_euryale.AAC.1
MPPLHVHVAMSQSPPCQGTHPWHRSSRTGMARGGKSARGPWTSRRHTRRPPHLRGAASAKRDRFMSQANKLMNKSRNEQQGKNNYTCGSRRPAPFKKRLPGRRPLPSPDAYLIKDGPPHAQHSSAASNIGALPLLRCMRVLLVNVSSPGASQTIRPWVPAMDCLERAAPHTQTCHTPISPPTQP